MCSVLIINKLCLYNLWIKRLASDKTYTKNYLISSFYNQTNSYNS